MKVLWITNILFPEAESQLIGTVGLKSSGGWMLGAAEALVKRGEITLYVASVSPLVDRLVRLQGEHITYYVIPLGKGNLRENAEYQGYWKIINSEIKPDVVHIHGTEYSHGHAYMKVCGIDNVLISIQGLKSSCSDYYHYGMSTWDIIRNITFRDLLRGTIFKRQRNFRRSARYEIDMLKMTKHVIGRTKWDKVHMWSINPEANYYFCNETLRPEFYNGAEWSYDNCRRHSIFLSQASYPLKGLHQVIKAMPLVLRHYPDAVIRVAGNDIISTRSFFQRLKLTGYGKYIRNLINKFDLSDHLEFVGSLNADQMVNEYLKSNVFICPSSLENSPNSLGEAQVLGVPCISSYVGGAVDMMKGNEDNLYRFEETEMLAYAICKVFADEDRQVSLKEAGLRRHDPELNSEQLSSIYHAVQSINKKS